MGRIFAAALLAAFPSIIHAASETRMIHEFSANVDRANQTIRFDMQFDRPLDLFTLDSFSRQVDQFQIFLWNTPALPYPILLFENFQVRVDAHNFGLTQGDWLVINVIPFQPHPTTALGSGQFTLDPTNTKYSFTVPWSLIGETDGLFSATLYTYHHGATTDQAHLIPTPQACAGGLALIAMGIAARVCRKRKLCQAARCLSALVAFPPTIAIRRPSHVLRCGSDHAQLRE
jgi:hypothetical protein